MLYSVSSSICYLLNHIQRKFWLIGNKSVLGLPSLAFSNKKETKVATVFVCFFFTYILLVFEVVLRLCSSFLLPYILHTKICFPQYKDNLHKLPSIAAKKLFN